MKKPLCLLLPWLFFGLPLLAQNRAVAVFEAGKEGYASYRIPALLSLPNKTLLAFCEGRKNSAADFGDVDILLKRSTDNGRSWSPLQLLVDNGQLQAGNPAPVLDQTDPRFPRGRLFLFYNTGNRSETLIRQGNGIREVWYISSVDGGLHWSAPRNITDMVHRPKQPEVNTAYQFADDWRSYANTPGHAIQIRSGKYAGRLYVAANHSAGPPQADFADYAAHGFYSDDHGEHFHLSEPVPLPGSNEASAAAISDGRLMLNCRNQLGSPRQRIVCLSADGGEHWLSSVYDPQLPDPVCEGSLLALEQRNGNTLLAFCNNASTTRRDSLTLRFSFDSGKTWPRAIVVDGNGTPTYTAYSDIAPVGEHRIAVLYERKAYSEIVFRLFRRP